MQQISLLFSGGEACTWLGIVRNMISTEPQAAAKFHSRGQVHGLAEATELCTAQASHYKVGQPSGEFLLLPY